MVAVVIGRVFVPATFWTDLAYQATVVTSRTITASGRPGKSRSSTVSFRLNGPLLQQLAECARASGASLGEQARALVLGALSDATHRATLAELALAREEVQRLRADVATTLEMLLLNVANLSEEEVKHFVRTNLRKEATPP